MLTGDIYCVFRIIVILQYSPQFLCVMTWVCCKSDHVHHTRLRCSCCNILLHGVILSSSTAHVTSGDVDRNGHIMWTLRTRTCFHLIFITTTNCENMVFHLLRSCEALAKRGRHAEKETEMNKKKKRKKKKTKNTL